MGDRAATNHISPLRILIKGILLFLLFNLLLLIWYPYLIRLSIYNLAVTGMERFPVSSHPPEDAALGITDLQVMLDSHIISKPKDRNEFRVIILGDSSIWGARLQDNQTLTGQLNSLGLKDCMGREVRFYNLGYVFPSVMKDLLILNRSKQYDPDLAIWMVALSAMVPARRSYHPLIEANSQDVDRLNRQFRFFPEGSTGPLQDAWSNYKKDLLTLDRDLHFQLFGAVITAIKSGQLQTNAEDTNTGPSPLNSNLRFEGLTPPKLRYSDLSIDMLDAGFKIADPMRLMVINEPLKIVRSEPNSDVQYNAYYPRWIYDQYRDILAKEAAANDWNYRDLWDAIPTEYFIARDSLHLLPAGEHLLAQQLVPTILAAACQ